MDMRSFDCFKQEGSWYKGNLHLHTTNSDGSATPEEAVDWYYRNGYDFLCITDHDVITDIETLKKKDFVLIPGIEFGYTPDEEPDFVLDMLGINIGELPDFLDPDKRGNVKYDTTVSPQRIIDCINKNGGLAIMCHPHFMFNMTEPYLKYHSYIGLETYNFVCDKILGQRGNQEVYWDALLYRGRRLMGFATDDSHQADFGHAWIEVKAKEKTLPAILDAIKAGCFYSTTGIKIYDVEFSDGRAKITFDRPCDVAFKCANAHSVPIYANKYELVDGQIRYSAEMIHPIRGSFLHIELRDSLGNKAYTNPIYL